MKLWAVVLGLMLALCAGAQADFDYSNALFPSPEAMGLGYSIAVGAMWPMGKDIDSSTAFSVSVAWYDPVGQEFGNQATIGLSADWTTVNRESDDKNVSLFPFLLNYKAYGSVYGYRMFVNLGLGIIGATDNIPEMKIEDGINFGWSGSVGIDITNHMFAQTKYIASDNPGDDGMLFVQLGYRF